MVCVFKMSGQKQLSIDSSKFYCNRFCAAQKYRQLVDIVWNYQCTDIVLNSDQLQILYMARILRFNEIIT